jgi:hypothetical protein
MRPLTATLAAALLLAPPRAATLPPSSLAVRSGDDWLTWWRSEDAPARWAAPLPAVTGAVEWRPAGPGLAWGELALSGTGEAWRLRVVLVRIDPARHDLRLVSTPEWKVDDAPAEALVALNAGQFTGSAPWGWVVRRRVERRTPGFGPLSSAFVVDTGGRVRLVDAAELPAARVSGAIAEAFQSYPTLLADDGHVPHPLQAADRGVSVAHRDARLAVGLLRDGQLLIALTRFDGLGDTFSAVPFGPTAPEMAAIMGALGARTAVMLDGGISGQLLLRTPDQGTQLWRGWRKVPLGLLVYPKGAAR